MSRKTSDDLIAAINKTYAAGDAVIVEGGTNDSREGKSTFYGVWAALHRSDRSELTAETAPGYERVPYTTAGSLWKDIPADWGWVHYISAWTEKTGGRCVTTPPLQPVEDRVTFTLPSL